jgi:hypothetical protein
MTDNRQATAVHEAGHARIAASQGIPILALVLTPPGHVSGCAGWVTLAREIDDPEAGVLIYLAGARAEFTFGLRSSEGHGWDDLKPDGSGSDLDAALKYARQIDPSDAHGLLLRRRWTVATLVNEHAAGISVLAGELLSAPDGCLDGPALARALDRAYVADQASTPTPRY